LCCGLVVLRVKGCTPLFVSLVWLQQFTTFGGLQNELCFGNSPLTEEALVAQIKWDVRTKVLTRKFKRSPLDRQLSALWML
jgi:hypothetical protein